jgi:hypothetical protein
MKNENKSGLDDLIVGAIFIVLATIMIMGCYQLTQTIRWIFNNVEIVIK